MRKMLLAAVMLFTLGACASGGIKTTGTVISQAEADHLVIGKTTIEDVKAKFGDPSFETTQGDVTLLTYKSFKELNDNALPMMGLHKDQSLRGEEQVSLFFNATSGKLSQRPAFQRNGTPYKKIHQAAEAK